MPTANYKCSCMVHDHVELRTYLFLIRVFACSVNYMFMSITIMFPSLFRELNLNSYEFEMKFDSHFATILIMVRIEVETSSCTYVATKQK